MPDDKVDFEKLGEELDAEFTPPHEESESIDIFFTF